MIIMPGKQHAEEIKNGLENQSNGKISVDYAVIASSPVSPDYGGIDFNPNELNLVEQGEGVEFNFDNAMLQNIQSNAVFGIQPSIISITPITNFAPLLGAAYEHREEAQHQLTRLP